MPHPSGGEDCWGEGGTACLVDEWGKRYVQLGRRYLRQKDWLDVADAVNRRQELIGRPRRTDLQCKNRIDTVKKMYRLEKSKPGPSTWPLLEKLDSLVSATPPPSAAAVRNLGLPLPTFTVKPRSSNFNSDPNLGGVSDGSFWRSRSQRSSESSRTDEDEDEDEGFVTEKRNWDGLVECERGRCSRRGRGGELGQLARAIAKFAEIYERVESAKLQQMVELERHKMEFVKNLEFQRMKMFMEAQLEIEKMKVKRPRYSSGSVDEVGGEDYETTDVKGWGRKHLDP